LIAEDIELAVARMWGIRMNVIVPNASWGADIHECDLLIVSSAGYLTEVEIKVTKADLKKDSTKRHGHRNDKIKFLFYAMPTSVWLRGIEELVPERAGIVTVEKLEWRDGYAVHVQRKPQANRTAKPISPPERYQLARLGAMRIWDLKERLQKVRQAMA
jgi:hypothetical protein